MGQEGLFIAFEGADGSGKTTQIQRLAERLRQNGHVVATFDFPRYDQPSSYFVREYLTGHYGQLGEIGPYTASLFYAMDRYQAAAEIRSALGQGKIVLSDRFTGSSMAHQGTKFLHAEQRRGFFIWLDNLEFQLLGIPRPDKNLILHVPVEFSEHLITSRERKRDIHEADPEHLAQATDVYDDLAQLFPKDFSRIDCVRGGKLLTVDQIHDMVWHSVEPLLPETPVQIRPGTDEPTNERPQPKPSKAKTVSRLLALHYAHGAEISMTVQTTDSYVVPDGLDKLTHGKYQAAMNRLFELYGTVSAKLKEQGVKDAEALTQAVLPLATKSHIVIKKDIEAPANDRALIEQLSRTDGPMSEFTRGLPVNHSSGEEYVALRHIQPRNELDIIPRALYPASDQSLAQIEQHVDTWPISKKAQALEAYLKGKDTPALAAVTYTWELLTSILTMQTFSQAIGTRAVWQPFSPRFGYAVPEAIESAGLSDEYEMCFDLSAKLYSVLQQAGHTAAAQYAVLAGHRVRWEINTTGSTKLPEHPVSVSMRQKQAEKHPILAENSSQEVKKP